MNNPTVSLIDPMTSLLENETSVGNMLSSPDIAQLAPIVPLTDNHLTVTPEMVLEVAQANIVNNNLSTVGLPGLVPLNAGVIGANVINTNTTASSNMTDINIIAGTGLFPLIPPVSFTNNVSAIPTQANIVNGIFASTNLPGLTYNTFNVPQTNIPSGSVPFMNLPGLVPITQPNNAMNQNFLNSSFNVLRTNTGFTNAFNTGGFGGMSVSEPYVLFSIIGALILFTVMRRKKNIFLYA